MTGTAEDSPARAETRTAANAEAGVSTTDVRNDISAAAPRSEPDVAAFDAFYRAHAGPIGQALQLTLGNPELAEDALNEAMARALQRWRKVAQYANPEGWVYRVGVNWAMSWLRRQRRERDRPLRPRTSVPTPADLDLAQALEMLSVDHRTVVVCRFFLDWSVRQTATALDVPEGTVKSRLARALDLIRTELEESP